MSTDIVKAVEALVKERDSLVAQLNSVRNWATAWAVPPKAEQPNGVTKPWAEAKPDRFDDRRSKFTRGQAEALALAHSKGVTCRRLARIHKVSDLTIRRAIKAVQK